MAEVTYAVSQGEGKIIGSGGNIVLGASVSGAPTTTEGYFNSWGDSGLWSDPGYAIDGSTETASVNSNNGTTYMDGISGAADPGGSTTITKVEIRVHGYETGSPAQKDIQPLFAGTDPGDLHDSDVPNSSPGWGGYIDITSDTNAPGTWDWDDVSNLDMNLTFQGFFDYWYISKVEIRVTYAGSVSTGNFIITNS